MRPHLLVVLACCGALGACAPRAGPGTVVKADAPGAPGVTLYAPSQAGAAERTLGYRVVEPTSAVRTTAGLPLAEVIVTEVVGQKTIHYIYGDLHLRWVLVMEDPTPQTRYAYDAAAEALQFTAHGRAISLTTNLPTATLDRIERRMGGPAPSAGG